MKTKTHQPKGRLPAKVRQSIETALKRSRQGELFGKSFYERENNHVESAKLLLEGTDSASVIPSFTVIQARSTEKLLGETEDENLRLRMNGWLPGEDRKVTLRRLARLILNRI